MLVPISYSFRCGLELLPLSEGRHKLLQQIFSIYFKILLQTSIKYANAMRRMRINPIPSCAKDGGVRNVHCDDRILRDVVRSVRDDQNSPGEMDRTIRRSTNPTHQLLPRLLIVVPVLHGIMASLRSKYRTDFSITFLSNPNNCVKSWRPWHLFVFTFIYPVQKRQKWEQEIILCKKA